MLLSQHVVLLVGQLAGLAQDLVRDAGSCRRHGAGRRPGSPRVPPRGRRRPSAGRGTAHSGPRPRSGAWCSGPWCRRRGSGPGTRRTSGSEAGVALGRRPPHGVAAARLGLLEGDTRRLRRARSPTTPCSGYEHNAALTVTRQRVAVAHLPNREHRERRPQRAECLGEDADRVRLPARRGAYWARRSRGARRGRSPPGAARRRSSEDVVPHPVPMGVVERPGSCRRRRGRRRSTGRQRAQRRRSMAAARYSTRGAVIQRAGERVAPRGLDERRRLPRDPSLRGAEDQEPRGRRDERRRTESPGRMSVRMASSRTEQTGVASRHSATTPRGSPVGDQRERLAGDRAVRERCPPAAPAGWSRSTNNAASLARRPGRASRRRRQGRPRPATERVTRPGRSHRAVGPRHGDDPPRGAEGAEGAARSVSTRDRPGGAPPSKSDGTELLVGERADDAGVGLDDRVQGVGVEKWVPTSTACMVAVTPTITRKVP